jgi:metal-responsive CopG/Arc/MetJ family transcriptional regulator
MRKMVAVGISLDGDELAMIDGLRGDTPRSVFVRRLIREAISRRGTERSRRPE